MVLFGRAGVGSTSEVLPTW